MKHFALIGKSISHSRSPQVYQQLLRFPHEYHLLDFENELEIPNLTDLATKYVGINITSPYKRWFLRKVSSSEFAKKCGSINCLKFKNNIWEAENTDYLAILELFKIKFPTYLFQSVAILGDGVMSQVVIEALNEVKCKYQVLSRKTIDNFDELNLNLYCEDIKKPFLIINTCSRDYVFHGQVPANALFWDLNYAFTPHLINPVFTNDNYIDGEELLLLQAKYACAFWSDIL